MAMDQQNQNPHHHHSSGGYQGGGGQDGRPGDDRGGFRGRGRGKKKTFHRRKICRFCADHISHVDYKDVQTLRQFITERGKINPRRINGNCAKHQRLITKSIIRARYMALLPYTAMVTSSAPHHGQP
ncbi:MAG: 30S ribosomal protein S18 [Deltaproteobacteria bacterium]|jgi:small subunit ribosomal protein S18|nr:30S ribosomal protein S18 [Deltaproteobacteria bacterium]